MVEEDWFEPTVYLVDKKWSNRMSTECLDFGIFNILIELTKTIATFLQRHSETENTKT